MAWHGLGWETFFSDIDKFPLAVLSTTTQASRVTETLQPSRMMNMEQSTFLSEEHPASHSASQVCEVEWMTTVATWHSNFLGLLNEKLPSGWFGKTSRCPVIERRTGLWLLPRGG